MTKKTDNRVFAMKRMFFTLLLSLFTAISWAYDAQVNSIYYNLNSEKKTAEVTYKELEGNSYSGQVTIPSSITVSGTDYTVTSVGNGAFSSSTNLQSVIIPNTVTSIASLAFSRCTNLQSVNIPNSVTSIGQAAFAKCTKLASVTIPDLVTSLTETFVDCSGLSSVTLSSSLTYIGESTFENCTSLTSITLPGTLQTLENSAFEGCTKLVSIEIPNLVTRVGNSAFSGCTSLKYVTLHSSSTTFEAYTFYGCTNLTTVTNLATTPQKMPCGDFDNVPLNKATLRIPAESESLYRAAVGWNGFGTIETIHTHSYAQTWTQTPTAHYHACIGAGNCDISDYSSLTDATSAAYGVHSYGTDIDDTSYFTCSVCGYKDAALALAYADNHDTDYLCFTAEEDNAMVAVITSVFPTEVDIQYSYNKVDWNDFTFSRNDVASSVYQSCKINLSKGNKVYLRAKKLLTRFGRAIVTFDNLSGTNTPDSYGKVAASGNVMSLIDPTCTETAVGENCFNGLFSQCKQLTTAPKFPALILGEGCYEGAFVDCSSLKKAPELPALSVPTTAYSFMFQGCTSLTGLPELKATDLGFKSYYKMFSGCTGIKVNTTGPGKEWSIPANATIDETFGVSMFENTSGDFTGVPVLGTTYYVLDPTVYHTFATEWTQTETAHYHACTKTDCTLQPADYATLTGDDATAAAYGEHSYDADITKASYFTCSVCGYKDATRMQTYIENNDIDYLCFTAEEDNAMIAISSYSPEKITIEYSYDKVNWSEFTFSSSDVKEFLYQSSKINLNKGDKVYVRSKTMLASFNEQAILTYDYLNDTKNNNTYGKVAASGNVMSLIDPTCTSMTVSNYCFFGTFYNCKQLTSAPKLPATTLGKECYIGIFGNCSSLKKAPELPAMDVPTKAYRMMFSNCTSLTELPELNATNLGSQCYYQMFQGCTGIKVSTTGTGNEWSIPAEATTLSGWNQDMFKETSGDFTGDPAVGTTYYITSAFALPSVTLNSAGYATYSSDKAATIKTAGVKAYFLTASGNDLTAVELNGVIPAGVGVVLQGTAGTVVELEVSTATAATNSAGNVLSPTTTATDAIVAKPTVSAGQAVWALGDADSFQQYSGDFIANRAYIIYNENAASGSGAKALRMFFPGETAIHTVATNDVPNKNGKYFVNGKLVIVKNGKKYSAQGVLMK